MRVPSHLNILPPGYKSSNEQGERACTTRVGDDVHNESKRREGLLTPPSLTADTKRVGQTVVK